MLKQTFRRLRRAPIPALCVLMFTAILSMILCGLQKANDSELEKYNETYHTIPVRLSVTNLSGTKSNDLNIPWNIANVFTVGGGLSSYVSDLEMVCKHPIAGEFTTYTLVGINSTVLTKELWPENGTYIMWNEGYDETIFATDEAVCLVPDAVEVIEDEETGESYVELLFENRATDPAVEYSLKLKVAGTYIGGGGKSLYCPYSICMEVYEELGEFVYVQAIRATLRNNDTLEELRTASMRWFAEPNPLGEKTPWGAFGYEYYPYALDINDDLLQRATAELQNSISINRICTVIVLSLSAAAGFLIGFLMVRNRKKEIGLMRTLGTSNTTICMELETEQILCVVAGVILGGSYSLWEPVGQLCIFAGVYIAGLSVALLVFMRTNLLATMKEDE